MKEMRCCLDDKFAWVSWIKKKFFENAIREQKEQLIMLLTPGALLEKEIIFEN